MTPEDFPQFDDPRVRAVMAAAANLVAAAAMHKDFRQFAYTTIEACQTALFAAQHSKPKVWPCPTKPGKTCTAAKCDWGCKT